MTAFPRELRYDEPRDPGSQFPRPLMTTGKIEIGPTLVFFPRLRERRAQRRALSARDRMNGWRQSAHGEWFRDTPQGDWLDPLLDRLAEDYVNDRSFTTERLIASVDAACERYAALLPGQHEQRLQSKWAGSIGATGATGVPMHADSDTPFACPPLEEIR